MKENSRSLTQKTKNLSAELVRVKKTRLKKDVDFMSFSYSLASLAPGSGMVKVVHFFRKKSTYGKYS